MDRPIPPFYCVYLLRSTISHGSLYVGSTPNPRRRLKQHNGLTRGGAVRTATPSLRPWEMTLIVSGFPSKIAALQFEWAWQNTHLTRHIPSNVRITSSRTIERTSSKTGKTRKRHVQPRASMMDKISNLHLLLRVKSFARWPLNVRFLAPSVFKVWEKWCRQCIKRLRPGINVFLDGSTASPGPTKAAQNKVTPETNIDGSATPLKPIGLDALDVSYVPIMSQLMKTTTFLQSTAMLNCSICHNVLDLQGELILVCSTESCKMTSHLTCLAGRFIADEGNTDAILPIEGDCPRCSERLMWSSLLRDLTLRTRGQEVLRQLLKEPKQKKSKGFAKDETSFADKENIGARYPELSTVSKPATFVLPRFVGEDCRSDDESSDDGFVYREDPLDDSARDDASTLSLNSDLAEDSQDQELPEPARSNPLQELSQGRGRKLPLVIADSEDNDLEDLID